MKIGRNDNSYLHFLLWQSKWSIHISTAKHHTADEIYTQHGAPYNADTFHCCKAVPERHETNHTTPHQRQPKADAGTAYNFRCPFMSTPSGPITSSRRPALLHAGEAGVQSDRGKRWGKGEHGDKGGGGGVRRRVGAGGGHRPFALFRLSGTDRQRGISPLAPRCARGISKKKEREEVSFLHGGRLRSLALYRMDTHCCCCCCRGR